VRYCIRTENNLVEMSGLWSQYAIICKRFVHNLTMNVGMISVGDDFGGIIAEKKF